MKRTTGTYKQPVTVTLDLSAFWDSIFDKLEDEITAKLAEDYQDVTVTEIYLEDENIIFETTCQGNYVHEHIPAMYLDPPEDETTHYPEDEDMNIKVITQVIQNALPKCFKDKFQVSVKFQDKQYEPDDSY